MYKQVMIIGAGGHAKVIADCVRKSGDTVFGFLDDGVAAGTQILGATVFGGVDEYVNYPDVQFIIGIGNNFIREKIAAKLEGVSFYTAIHPTAYIGEGSVVGEGTCVMANAVINACATVGKHCIINTASVVEHDCKLDDFVHLSTTAAVAGTVTVGKKGYLGIGSRVRNNTDICENVIVGAGGVVVKNITEEGTYIGVPARKVK